MNAREISVMSQKRRSLPIERSFPSRQCWVNASLLLAGLLRWSRVRETRSNINHIDAFGTVIFYKKLSYRDVAVGISYCSFVNLNNKYNEPLLPACLNGPLGLILVVIAFTFLAHYLVRLLRTSCYIRVYRKRWCFELVCFVFGRCVRYFVGVPHMFALDILPRIRVAF